MSAADDVRARLDIVDVVSGYVALRKAGRNYKALCPFHNEKTPSFVVTPERQTWHCFGACSTGGDAISFVMRQERLEFGEALRQLADKAGVTLSARPESGRLDATLRVIDIAASFYQEVLASEQGVKARKYLDERRVGADAVKTFRLGLSPRGGNKLLDYLSVHEVDLELAVAAGLLRRAEDGSLRDFFWGRLMFPISDRRGRVIGFGGRSLDGSEPKYINTAATPTFDKRNTLYALHLAATPARDSDSAIVVEGYMDVIAAHEHGYSNVVASMGTALTEQQVARLKSLTSNFILALDPDVAGQEATLRSLEASWRAVEGKQIGQGRGRVGPLYQREQPNLKIALLPEGSDPDTLIREQPEKWDELVEHALPYVDYMIRALPEKFDLDTTDGKAQAAEAMRPLVTMARNAFEQEETVGKLARVLGVGVEMLKATMKTSKPASTRQPRRAAAPREALSSAVAGRDEHFLEDYLVSLVIDRPELKEAASGIELEQFHRTEDREVFTSWMACTTMDELRARLDDALHDHLDYLIAIELAPIDRSNSRTALDQCLRRLEERHLHEVQETMLLSADSTSPPSRDLEEAIVGVNSRLKELQSQPN